MNEVYVVTRGEYSDYRIEAVFDNEAAADQFIANAKRSLSAETFRYSHYRVEPWAVQSQAPLSHTLWHVHGYVGRWVEQGVWDSLNVEFKMWPDYVVADEVEETPLRAYGALGKAEKGDRAYFQISGANKKKCEKIVRDAIGKELAIRSGIA